MAAVQPLEREVYQLTSLFERMLEEARPGRIFVAAVSGGEDSVVLLDLLAECSAAERLSVHVAHVDHRLRPESRDEAEFVRTRAQSYGLPVRIHTAEPPASRTNVEAWARNIRYSFFESLRAEVGADAVITAHHREDQAETLLLRLLSGRLKSSSRCMPLWDPERRLFRPLLHAAKLQIRQYSQTRALPFIDDASNRDLSFTRNRVRRELLPHLIESYNPNLTASLSELAGRLADDERALAAMAAEQLARLDYRCSAAVLRALPEALAWRILKRKALHDVGKDAEYLGYDAIQRVLYCVNVSADKNRVVELGFGITCRISGAGEITFQKTGKMP